MQREIAIFRASQEAEVISKDVKLAISWDEG